LPSWRGKDPEESTNGGRETLRRRWKRGGVVEEVK